MKKALIVIGVIALVLWIASWFRNGRAVTTATARPWPAGMGPLDSAGARVPPLQANAAAMKLAKLANALPKNDAIEVFVSREIARDELAIGAPPPRLPDVTAIRELLLREPVVWKRQLGIGGDDDSYANRGMRMTTARALIASALAKARANDAASWDDLLAVWKLARSLDGHPQVMSQTAALSMARMINAVAWKMPLPAPAWLDELQQRDGLPPLVEAYYQQTASYAKDGLRIFPTKMLADSVDHDRAIAEELLRETRCDPHPRANELGVDLTSIWRRAFRYRAEREATANALRVREGKPIVTTSRCSDGSWTLDGTTLRFSRNIASEAPAPPMPLVLRVR